MKPHPPQEPNPGLDRLRHELASKGGKTAAISPLRSGVHSRGYLPHAKREGAAYFVTFRLADSLPKEVLLQFEAERAQRLRSLNQSPSPGRPSLDTEEGINRDFQRKVERFLDRGHGSCHLRRREVASLVADAVRFFEGERYALSDWVIMPNHVHVVLWPMPNYRLGDILKSWKQYTSRRTKPIVGLDRDRFWQVESYDHWIRNDDEQARICRYIRNNPVTARLCARPEDWPWSSAWAGCRADGNVLQDPA